MTPEEKAKKKEEARKKKEEAKRKKEEAKRKKEEARRKKRGTRPHPAEKAIVDALMIEVNACSKSPLLQEQQTDQKGSMTLL